MKKLILSFITLTVLSAVLTTASAADAVPSQVVLDIAGHPVHSNVQYYIIPAKIGNGGGLIPSSRNSNIQDLCLNLDIVQSSSPFVSGLPVTFSPLNTKTKLVQLSTSLNLEFDSTVWFCPESKIWKIDHSVQLRKSFVSTGGKRGKGNSWFQIQEDGDAYKLMYCPPSSTVACINVLLVVRVCCVGQASERVKSTGRVGARIMGEEEASKGEDTVEDIRRMRGYGGDVIIVGGFPASKSESESESESDLAAAEIMVIWAIQGPTSFAPNSLVAQSSLELRLDACGHSLSILQSPCSLNTPGVTGSVMWDSGVVLGKFLEHSVDSKVLSLEGKKIVELGSGCGLVGCIAALLGGNVVLTDLPDRLRLLKKNIQTNLHSGNTRGSATVQELVWGDDPDPDLIEPFPDYVLGSDVIYSEEAVHHLVKTLLQLCGDQTTIFLAGELRNDAVLEYFLETALQNFAIGRVEQTQWHPDYRSLRVVLYVLEKKSERCLADDSSLNLSY